MTAPSQRLLAAATRPVVIVNIDGILAFTVEAAASIVNAHLGLSLLVSGLTSPRVGDALDVAGRRWLAEQMGRGVFWANVAPDSDAIRAVGEIHVHHHVILASGRDPAATGQATDAWLSAWGVQYDSVMLGGDLLSRVSQRPVILVDDDPVRVFTAGSGVQVWSPQRPWTPRRDYPDFWVFPSWDAVLARLKDGV